MPPTDTFPLVDRLVPGGLGPYLCGAREAGESHDRIARRLWAEHDIDVTAETVRKWCRRVEVAA